MADRPLFDSIKLVLISFIVAALVLFAYHQLFHAKSELDTHTDDPADGAKSDGNQSNASD